jgi:threonylcarbamoyladenosine tRNA methylthiotransferase MtaB
LGCKLNFSETSTIARQLTDMGCARVEMDASPDIFVLNTCSVTENADKKCKQLVKKVMQTNPATYVIVIGCYAQLKPQEISEIPGVDLVLGANEKFNIPEYLENAAPKGEPIVKNESIKQTTEFVPSHSMGDRTRSFLKIQDGCDYFCTFCTIFITLLCPNFISISALFTDTVSIISVVIDLGTIGSNITVGL